MNIVRSLRYFALAVSLPITFVYWPSACSQPTPARHSGAGPAALTVTSTPQDSGPSITLPHPAFAQAAGEGKNIADIAERVTAHVVNIASERVRKRRGRFPFGFPFGGQSPQGKRKEQGLGSGVIVSEDGVILTNNHVIEEASEIRVTTADGREFDASVVGADKKSDLAVLKLQGKVSGLKAIRLGDSSSLRLGDVVLAVGNPFGIGQTVTMGIVSAKGRADVGIVDYEDFIQTDAAINPGNSGGALINMRGELVGINTAILSRSGGYQGIGFAIPTKMAQPIMTSLLENGKVVRGHLGVNIQDVDPALAEALGLGDAKGVLIAAVSPGSPAAKAGLKRGDVVTAVDDILIDSTGRLRNTIASRGAGAEVMLKVHRDGKTRSIKVLLGELKGASAQAESEQQEDTADRAGLALVAVTPELRERLGLPKDGAKVAVAGVAQGGTAAEAGVRRGDAILEINRTLVKSVAQAKKLLAKAKGPVLMVIQRGQGTRYLVLPGGK